MAFVHLNCHSHFSILKGLPKPAGYLQKAGELGMPGVALTDLYNIHGGHEFYKAAKNSGVNPIMGAEILVTNDSISKTDGNIPHNLVVLAKNLAGYKNIIGMITESNLEGLHNGVARIDHDILKKYAHDIIVLSGPKSGDIPYHILSGRTDDVIMERIKYYQDLLGKDNFYLQLMNHSDIPKQDLINERLIELHKSFDIPVVAANGVYYIEKDDKKTQDVIMCQGSGHTLDNPDRPTMINGDYSFKTEEEMQADFGFIPSALDNTLKINDQIHIEFKTGGVLIPKYDLPENDQAIYEEAQELEKNELGLKKLSSDEWYLRYLCFEGLNWRYDYGIPREHVLEFVKKLDKPSLDKKLQETSPEELKDLSLTYYTDKKKELLATYNQDVNDKIVRLEYELVVVHEMGFDAYFLIVADYINRARDHDIPVGPGRGSAAGALLAYLSGITDIDPLKYDLLFERFLNPARVSMPDIDTDFADDSRGDVIDYCRRKYGADHVAQICTFGTFAARAAVKDVGRTHGLPFQDMNKLAAQIPEKPGTKLKKALEESPEFKNSYDTDEKYREIIDQALAIEGNVRQLGVHACAVIIAPEKMTNFTALQHPPKDTSSIVTQYAAYPLEDLGLLKMDFLGLRNLTIIKRALAIIKASKGDEFDILKIAMDDQKVFEVFCNGDTTGVFQFESDGMRKYLKELKPNTFEDIIVMVSLYRPGPLQYIPTYIDRKHGREQVEYPHESLEQILSPTQGIAVYQEQIMQMVQAFAGFSLGEADILRRAIGKKKIDVLMEQKSIFVREAGKQGHSEELALHIFEDVIEPFAGYGFNKSHAACYAFIAYQTAFLKAYYPTEFLTAIMTQDEENMERIVLEVGESESKGISVLPPNVNASLKHFTYINDETIRFGLKAIKGLGDGPIDAIINARQGGQYEDLEDFITRTGKDVINKRSLEALIQAGAMDDFGERGNMFGNITEMIRFAKELEKKNSSDQMGLFDLSGGSGNFDDGLNLGDVPPFNFERKLSGEKEMLGFRVSGHPFDNAKNYIAKRSKNLVNFRKSFDELRDIEKNRGYKFGQEPKKENKDTKKKARPFQETITTMGFVYDAMKFVTKSGKNMIILKCENYDSDFEVTIFPKDYEKYKDVQLQDRIIFVEGFININTEFERKSVSIKTLNFLTITDFRVTVRDSGYATGVKFNKFLQTANNLEKKEEENEVEVENIEIEEKNVPKIEQKVEKTMEKIQKKEEKEVKTEKKLTEYVITIPENAKKQDLADLKVFLSGEEMGETEVFINFKGQKISTKISLSNILGVKKWEKEKWG